MVKMMNEEKNRDENNNQEKNANDEPLHSDLALSEIINDIKNHLGLILCAEAGHGKSYCAAQIAKQAMKDPNLTVIVLSPSTIWRRNLWSKNCVKVGTNTFNPIVPNEETEVEVVPFMREAIHVNLDKKWDYVKSAWLEELLRSKQNLLFEIKYRNGRRIKAFESVVLQFIYEMQEKEIDRNPEYKHHYLIILEEIQNSFGTYSMNSDDSLDLMTLFTQSRSDANTHYLGIGQRLNDVSCKVVERLRPMVGLTLGENSLRKLKAMIPDDETKKRIQTLPQRHWIYLDGKLNPEIEILIFKKEGKPTFLKPTIPQEAKPQKKGILTKLYWQFWGMFGNSKLSRNSETNSSERSVYNPEEETDTEIEDDAIIQDELGL